ncbi:MAG TPA: zinc ribbon domain-containing protein [candidate division Zixibacteria bacterium]|jgi:putative FmdB family regulatory protein
MPTYEYRCRACGHEFEAVQPITDEPVRLCPQCGKEQVERLISPGAGLLFKGSGFYITDYRSESYKKSADAEKPKPPKPKSESKTDPKPTGGSKSSD